MPVKDKSLKSNIAKHILSENVFFFLTLDYESEILPTVANLTFYYLIQKAEKKFL